MNLITIDEIPKSITKVLGTTNREIINTIIMDILNNSIDHNYLKVSPEIFNAIKELKKFNYEHIYDKANTKEEIEHYKEMFNTVFNKYLEDLNNNNSNSRINTIFLNDMTEEYKKNNSNARKVIDYIAGMTDDFIESEYNKIINN